MTPEVFLSELAELLQCDTSPALEAALPDVPEWDSLAKMLFIAYADQKTARKISLDELAAFARVEDLYRFLVPQQ